MQHMYRGPRSVICKFSGWWFSFHEPPWTQISLFCVIFSLVLALWLPQSFLSLFHRLSLHNVWLCVYLFTSASGWSLSVENWTRQWSMSITEYHYKWFHWLFPSFSNHAWFNPRSIGCSASGFEPFRQWWAPSHSISLWLATTTILYYFFPQHTRGSGKLYVRVCGSGFGF